MVKKNSFLIRDILKDGPVGDQNDKCLDLRIKIGKPKEKTNTEDDCPAKLPLSLLPEAVEVVAHTSSACSSCERQCFLASVQKLNYVQGFRVPGLEISSPPLPSGSASTHSVWRGHHPLRVFHEGGESTPNLKFKRCRRSRTVFTEIQLSGLERRFDAQKYLSTPDRQELAQCLRLTQLQVKTWYQNRRMKWKKQVMKAGSKEPPTKPKGRPRKDSVLSFAEIQKRMMMEKNEDKVETV